MPSPQIPQPCPPGACGREQLLETAGSDLRILRLTRQEEKRLLERLENIESLSDLEKLQQRMYEQLAIRRGLEKHPEIAYRRLDAHDLFRDV